MSSENADVTNLLHEKTAELSQKLSQAIEEQLFALAHRPDPPAFVALWCGLPDIQAGDPDKWMDRALVTVNQRTMVIQAETAGDFDEHVKAVLSQYRGEALILRRDGAWLPGIEDAVREKIATDSQSPG